MKRQIIAYMLTLLGFGLLACGKDEASRSAHPAVVDAERIAELARFFAQRIEDAGAADERGLALGARRARELAGEKRPIALCVGGLDRRRRSCLV